MVFFFEIFNEIGGRLF